MNVVAPRPGLLIWLLVSQLVGLGSLVPWLAVAGLSFLAFDAPAASASAWPYILVGAVLAWPIVPIACSVVAWVLYGKRRNRAAAIVTGLPWLAMVALVLLLLAAGSLPG